MPRAGRAAGEAFVCLVRDVVQRQAEKEERERRKAEALAAKRYPIDDLQLLEELAQAAAESGARL